MNQPETLEPAEYILAMFEANDLIAILSLNRDLRETVQRITRARTHHESPGALNHCYSTVQCQATSLAVRAASMARTQLPAFHSTLCAHQPH